MAQLRFLWLLLFPLSLAVVVLAERPNLQLQAAGFQPLPQAVPAPADNPATAAKIALGKQLFFDPRLSGDNTMSCATCHQPDKAFGDGQARARGHQGKELARNTPSLLNVAYYTTYFWDGRAGSLEQQALMPIEAPVEMNQNLSALEGELGAVPGYVSQFQAIFHTRPTRQAIAQALAAFQRTIVSRNAPFDRYLAGDRTALSEQAQRGLELFRGAAGCIRCHNGPAFSDNKFYRLGVGSKDEGRAAISDAPRERFAFRTPSLRDVARTGPYMHNGAFATLTQVVEYYYRGIPAQMPDQRPPDVAPLLGQSYSEIADLVAFLESLSGEPPQITPPKLP